MCIRDRESIGQPCVTSKVVNTVEDAVDFTNEIGYPVIVLSLIHI